jgi:hypothetical protein
VKKKSVQLLNVFTGLLLVTQSGQSIATSIEQQTLDFGTIVISQNNTVSSVSVSANGGTSVVGDIYVLEAGQPAELLITDLPSNQLIYLSKVDSSELQNSDSSKSSTDFSVSLVGFPRTEQTDELGELLLYIGGRLSTTGNSQDYADGEFLTVQPLEISVNY